MQFYALFPLFYLTARRLPAWAGCALLGLGSMVLAKLYAIGVAQGWWPGFDEPSLLVMKLPMFLVGMLIYEGGRKRSAACLAAAAGLLALACRGYGVGAGFLVLLVGALAALWAFGTPARLGTFTGSRTVRFLSAASYAVYLVHGLILAIFGSRLLARLSGAGVSPDLQVLALTALVLPLSYAIAWAAYRSVELPGIRLGKAVVDREPRLTAAVGRAAAALRYRMRALALPHRP